MEASISGSNQFKPFDIPVKMGLLLAIIKIVFSTISYSFFLGSWGMTMLMTGLSFVIGLFILHRTGVMQRKGLGGFIDIKQAFQAVFVAAVIAVIIGNTYDIIYMKFIDPSMMDKIKESSIGFAEKMGAPQEKLDEMAEDFDKQNADKNNIGKQLLGFGMYIVWYGIVSFIIAAIVKKNKPVFDNSPQDSQQFQ